MKRLLPKIPYALAAACILLVFLLPLFVRDEGGFIDMPYVMYVLAGSMYSFPGCIAVMHACRLLSAYLEKAPCSQRQRVLHGIGGLASIGITATLFSLDTLVYVSLALAGVVVLTWIVEALMEKREMRFRAIWKDKTVWILVLVIVVIVTGIAAVVGHGQSSKNRREESMVPMQAAEVDAKTTDLAETLIREMEAPPMETIPPIVEPLARTISRDTAGLVTDGYTVAFDFVCSLYPGESYTFSLRLPKLLSDKPGAVAFNQTIEETYRAKYREHIAELEKNPKYYGYYADVTYTAFSCEDVLILWLHDSGGLLGTGGVYGVYDTYYYDTAADTLLTHGEFLDWYTDTAVTMDAVLEVMNGREDITNLGALTLTEEDIYGIIPTEQGGFYVLYQGFVVEPVFASAEYWEAGGFTHSFYSSQLEALFSTYRKDGAYGAEGSPEYPAVYIRFPYESYPTLTKPDTPYFTIRDVFTEDFVAAVIGKDAYLFQDVDTDGSEEAVVIYPNPQSGHNGAKVTNLCRIYDVYGDDVYVCDPPKIEGLYAAGFAEKTGNFILQILQNGGTETIRQFRLEYMVFRKVP